MLAAARDGEGAAECMMACLPCMLSYGWIFGELIRRSPGVENTPYWPFVRDYAGNRYDAICRGLSELLTRPAKTCTGAAKSAGRFPCLLPPVPCSG